MAVYKAYFANAGVAVTGLTLTWASLKKVSDGTDEAAQPAFTEIGGGWYKYTYSPTEDMVGVIDGSATITEDVDRYVPADFTASDTAITEITAARMGALTDWINGGRLDLILDDILLDTGTTLPALISALEAGSYANYFADPAYNTVGYELVAGTLVSGTTADTDTVGTPMVFAPTAIALLDVNFAFELSTARPSEVTIRGYIDGTGAAALVYADVYYYDYEDAAWAALSDAGNRIALGAANAGYTYVIPNSGRNETTGQVKLRFVSSRANAADRLYLDQMVITGTVSGMTAGDLAEAVWLHNIQNRALDGSHTSSGWALSRQVVDIGLVTAVNGAEITMSGTRFRDVVGLYDGRTIQFHKNGEDVYEVRKIKSQATGGVLTLDKATVSPVVANEWHAYILPASSDGVATEAKQDAAKTVIDTIASDVVNIDGAAPALASVCTEARLAELAAANLPADVDTLLTRITAAVATEAKQDTIDALVDAVKVVTDALPEGGALTTLLANVAAILADTGTDGVILAADQAVNVTKIAGSATVDGLTLTSFTELLVALAGGNVTSALVGSDIVLTFKKQDGTTTKMVWTTATDGTRTVVVS